MYILIILILLIPVLIIFLNLKVYLTIFSIVFFGITSYILYKKAFSKEDKNKKLESISKSEQEVNEINETLDEEGIDFRINIDKFVLCLTISFVLLQSFYFLTGFVYVTGKSKMFILGFLILWAIEFLITNAGILKNVKVFNYKNLMTYIIKKEDTESRFVKVFSTILHILSLFVYGLILLKTI